LNYRALQHPQNVLYHVLLGIVSCLKWNGRELRSVKKHNGFWSFTVHQLVQNTIILQGSVHVNPSLGHLGHLDNVQFMCHIPYQIRIEIREAETTTNLDMSVERVDTRLTTFLKTLSSCLTRINSESFDAFTEVSLCNGYEPYILMCYLIEDLFNLPGKSQLPGSRIDTVVDKGVEMECALFCVCV
jgi:hypothetical protein